MSEISPHPFEDLRQYGNNFFMLFLAILMSEAKIPKNEILDIKLKKAENNYKEAWQNFIKDNQDFFKELEPTLIRMYELRVLMNNDKLVFSEEEEAAQDVEYDLIWVKLNELLKKATLLMNNYGIDARQFFG